MTGKRFCFGLLVAGSLLVSTDFTETPNRSDPELIVTKAYTLYPQQDDTVGYGKEIDTTLQLAFRLSRVNFDSAFRLCEMTCDKILTIGDRRRFGVYSATKGAILFYNGRSRDAVPLLDEALSIAIEFNRAKFRRIVLNLIFSNYLIMGLYDEALEYGLKLEEAGLESRDDESSMLAYANLGLLYYKLLDSKKALTYYDKAQLFIGSGPRSPLMSINIGLCYNQLGKRETALSYIREAYNYRGAFDKEVFVTYENALANTYLSMEQYDSALLHAENSVRFAVQQGHLRFIVENTNLMAEIFFQRGNYFKCIEFLNAAQKLCIENGLNSLLKEVYGQFADVYQRSGQYHLCARYRDLYTQQWRVVHGEDVLNHIALLESRFGQQLNEKKIVANGKLIKIQANSVELRSGSVRIAALAFVLLLFVSILLLRQSNRQRAFGRFLESEVQRSTTDLEQGVRLAISRRNRTNAEVLSSVRALRARLATVIGFVDLLSLGRQASDLSKYKGLVLRFRNVELKLRTLLESSLETNKSHNGL